MKKRFTALFFCLMAAVLFGGGARQGTPATGETQGQSTGPEQQPSAGEQPRQEGEARRIAVQFGQNTVVYELNESAAADSLYQQLPLRAQIEDYSTNEKIFYPPQELSVSGTPLAQGGAGTLAYYAPWGDVVMFYGDYQQNSSLYELGQAVSGAELIQAMEGTAVIQAVEEE